MVDTEVNLFVEIDVPDKEKRLETINVRRITIGRRGDCVLAIDHATVSREHARIEMDPRGFARIVDLGSKSGTWVNDFQSPKQPIYDGDVIRIGECFVRILAGAGRSKKRRPKGSGRPIASTKDPNPTQRKWALAAIVSIIAALVALAIFAGP